MMDPFVLRFLLILTLTFLAGIFATITLYRRKPFWLICYICTLVLSIMLIRNLFQLAEYS